MELKMRYIPGSIFVNTLPRYSKFLKKGLPHKLRIIKPSREDDTYLYVFDTNDGQKEIRFNSVTEADDFLENFVV